MDFPEKLKSLEPEALLPLARENLSSRRFLHTLGVEDRAITLALRWGADVTEARRAALLHDMTKEARKELKLLEFCDIVPYEWEETAAPCRHALTAAALARRWGFSPEVTDAVRWHTTGRAGMGLLEKIIYLADLTEPFRSDFPGLAALRRTVFDDIDGAMRLGLSIKLAHVEKKGQLADPATRQALSAFEKLCFPKETGI